MGAKRKHAARFSLYRVLEVSDLLLLTAIIMADSSFYFMPLSISLSEL